MHLRTHNPEIHAPWNKGKLVGQNHPSNYGRSGRYTFGCSFPMLFVNSLETLTNFNAISRSAGVVFKIAPGNATSI